MVKVEKNDGESNESLIRRFVRKVQTSGRLIQAKKNMFVQPKPNKRQLRQSAIRKKKIEEEKDYLRKIGKLEDNKDKYGRKKAPNLKIKIKK